MPKRRKTYAVARVCNDCPFRRTGGVRLTKGRAREIAGYVLDEPGAAFWCHKTTGILNDDPTPVKLHCAGALVFAEKHSHATQLTRIMERIGCYDAKALMATPEVADVFDDLAGMLACQWPDRRRTGR